MMLRQAVEKLREYNLKETNNFRRNEINNAIILL